MPVRFTGGAGGSSGDGPPTFIAEDTFGLDENVTVGFSRTDSAAVSDGFVSSAVTLLERPALSDTMLPVVGPLGLVRSDSAGFRENHAAVNLVDTAPTMDTWTDGDNPNDNHGSDTVLTISAGILGVQPERFAFLAWDFTSMDGFTAVSGDDDLTFTFYFQTPLAETPFTMRVDSLVQASQPWVENTITHNNAPSHPNLGEATISFPLLAGAGDRTFTLSDTQVGDVLGNWLSLRVQMSGLVEVGDFGIRSREHATVADRPRLDFKMEKNL